MKFYRFIRAAIRFCADEATGERFYPYDYAAYYRMTDAYRAWKGIVEKEPEWTAENQAALQRSGTTPVSYGEALVEIRDKTDAQYLR